MMSDFVGYFVRAWRIDSFQKLRLLLFLHQNPKMKGTQEELAKCLYLGHTFPLEDIITDLQRAGLLDCVDSYFTLPDEPEIREGLHYLARAFEHPLTRVDLLDQLKFRPLYQHYREVFDEYSWSATR